MEMNVSKLLTKFIFILHRGMHKMPVSRGLMTILIVVAVGGVFIFSVPIIPISYEEAYDVSVPYEEQEAYTVEFPYTVLRNKTEPIGSAHNFTLEGGYYAYWDYYIPSGREVGFSVSASDPVNLYIFTSSQFSSYVDTGSAKPNEKELLEVSMGKLNYHVSSSETYYFVIYNFHSGSLEFEKKDVEVYAALIMARWEEKITKYRTETRYRTVTKYRTETHTRTITKMITLREYITGSY